MQRLINNPLFRIIGIIAILYYGLFYNKTQPDSLGNRLSPEKVKSNLQEISSHSVTIMSNIKKIDELKASENVPIQEQEKDLKETTNDQ